MAFRSDRQALVQRAEALEQELREVRAASEAEVTRRQEELAQLRSLLENLPADRNPARARLLLGLGVALFAVAGAGAYLMMLRAGTAPAPVAIVQDARVPIDPVAVPAYAVAVPPPGPVAAPPTAPPPTPPPSPVDLLQLLPRRQPSRAEVQAVFTEARPEVLRCAAGLQGTVGARVTFSGATGRVTSATVVNPPFAGTPAASCMARALRDMAVEPFENPTLTVTFPYAVR
jgi:hypothetical protein